LVVDLALVVRDRMMMITLDLVEHEADEKASENDLVCSSKSNKSEYNSECKN